ncbi:7-methylguanosine phosphate-specific 5'-nucleotidase isoform 2-T4 [Glossophaga mutica]
MVEEVSALMKATVLMRQPGRVQEIVSALRRGGGDRLQVISDFDMTLSRFACDGKRCPSSYNILDNSKMVSEECRKELNALLHHYYPIEIDPHRTVKEKLPHMVEWWTKAHDLLCQQKIQKCQIAQVVRESSAMLREGYRTFFNTLYQNNIPLFIFSAGIGDVLEEIIRQMKVLHPNIHIVSNYMDFDEDVSRALSGWTRAKGVSCRDSRASSYTRTTRTAPCARTPVISSSFRAKPTSSCWETPWGTSRWPMGSRVWRTFSRLAS